MTKCHFELNDNFVFTKQQKVDIQVHFDYSRIEIAPNKQAVRLTASTAESKEYPFLFNVEIEGEFAGAEGTEENLRNYMRYNSLATLVPYVRETVSNLTTRAGIAPFFIPPVNVQKLVAASEAEQQSPAVEATKATE